MNNTMKFYFLVDDTFDNVSILEKMLFLITKKKIELQKENRLIKASEVSVNDFTKIASSLKTMASDLNLDVLEMIVVPFYDNKLVSIAIPSKTGVYFLYDILLHQYNEKILDIEAVTSILKDVPKEILITVKNYIRLNQSLSQTGELMFAHRNTINYRINRFINITSINVREMQNAVLVYFILTLMDLD